MPAQRSNVHFVDDSHVYEKAIRQLNLPYPVSWLEECRRLLHEAEYLAEAFPWNRRQPCGHEESGIIHSLSLTI